MAEENYLNVFPFFFRFILCFVFLGFILKSCVAFSKTIKTLPLRFVFWTFITSLTLSLCLSSHSINANFCCLAHCIWFLLTHNDLDFLRNFDPTGKNTDFYEIETKWNLMKMNDVLHATLASKHHTRLTIHLIIQVFCSFHFFVSEFL